MGGALDGLRVVEIAGLGPAPFAAMMLADHGAEILRIHALKPRRGIPAVDSRTDVLARGRCSVALDLKHAEGRALALDLAAGADVFLEGFRPGVAERLGLGPEPCLKRNPALVYGRMTGWGQTGPLAMTAGHDLNYIALSGVLAAIGPAERPAVPLNMIGDFGAGGMLMAFGLLAAVFHAQRSGQGQVVDTAMSDGTALLSSMIHGFRAEGAWRSAREANLLDGGAYFYGTYRCADGKFVAVGAIEPQFHSALLEGLGLDPEAFDQSDQSRWPACRDRIARVFASQSRAHWETHFAGSDACVTPVLEWDEAVDHPHNQARDAFFEAGGVTQPAPAPKFSVSPAERPTPPGLPDARFGTILARWGIAAQRSAELAEKGVLGFWPD